LYETRSGDLVVLARDGYHFSSARTVAVRFDVANRHFDPPTIIQEAEMRCYDSARTGSGRLYVVSTLDDVGKDFARFEIAFSDDDGRTWSPPGLIPTMGPMKSCPDVAASKDELFMVWSDARSLLFARVGAESVCNP
jgi:hypothetical protein